MILEQEPKQKIEIHIKIDMDHSIAQEEYDRLKDINEYLKKGFSEQQSRYFNRRNEELANRLENGSMDCVTIFVSAEVEMPCNHIETFMDSLGGNFVEKRQDIYDAIKYYSMIENVKDQIKEKGIIAEYEIIEDFD